MWIQGVAYFREFLDRYSHLKNIIPEPRSESCFNISLSTDSQAEEVSWHSGPCAGAQQYFNNAAYTEECCH